LLVALLLFKSPSFERKQIEAKKKLEHQDTAKWSLEILRVSTQKCRRKNEQQPPPSYA